MYYVQLGAFIVYSLYTLYKEREPNYLITSLSFCRFTPSIRVVAYYYL